MCVWEIKNFLTSSHFNELIQLPNSRTNLYGLSTIKKLSPLINSVKIRHDVVCTGKARWKYSEIITHRECQSEI